MIRKDEKFYDEWNASHFVSFKFKRKIKLFRLTSLNIMLKMGFIKGPRFIEALLMRSEIEKELFLMDIELGNETLLPQGINLKEYAYSFRYYDFILNLIQ